MSSLKGVFLGWQHKLVKRIPGTTAGSKGKGPHDKELQVAFHS
jgi:hypothetical protein